jgi:hypothetical protein
LACGFNGCFRVTLRKRKWFFAEDMLAGLCRGDDLTGMQRVGRGQNHGVDFGIDQQRFEVFKKSKFLRFRKGLISGVTVPVAPATNCMESLDP